MATSQKTLGLAIILAAVLCPLKQAISAETAISGLHIKSIRSVGQYNPSQQFNEVVELWFTEPLVFPINSLCKDSRRLIVNSKYYHLVIAAHLAFSKGRTINVAIDETLPVRDGACEISYFDVLPQ